MKRREFGLLASTGILAASGASDPAMAQTDPAQLLRTTLTPMGSERAGNAAGTIPAWTGGFTTVPPDWDPDRQMLPDFFADEQPAYTVNASNTAQYTDMLSDGVRHLIQNVGFNLDVYNTRRTAAAPEWVYENIAQNAVQAQLNPGGGRLGFTGGYGGIPFPIVDTSDPFSGGAQVIWNHLCRWNGAYYTSVQAAYSSSGGQLQLSGLGYNQDSFPYYDQNGSLATYQGYKFLNHERFLGPPSSIGLEIVSHFSTNSLVHKDIIWELLQGQGRVRKAPELLYDTPAGYLEDIVNYDELFGFNGSPGQYDWKLLGKKELLIPYNNNALRRARALDAHLPKFMNPALVRWELHRVWVVEATLHPGYRNVIARRQLYVDEDTWIIGVSDGWDANGNIYKAEINYNHVFPNLPGTIFLNQSCHNLQTGDYASTGGPWGDPPMNNPESFQPLSPSVFDPQTLAAAASY